MRRRPPRSTRTDTLLPYTTLFRSLGVSQACRFARPLPALTPTRPPGRVRAAVALAWWESSSPLIAPSWQLLARLDRALPMPLLRSEEHTSELQSLMRISYAVFCLKKKKTTEPQRLTYIYPYS